MGFFYQGVEEEEGRWEGKRERASLGTPLLTHQARRLASLLGRQFGVQLCIAPGQGLLSLSSQGSYRSCLHWSSSHHPSGTGPQCLQVQAARVAGSPEKPGEHIVPQPLLRAQKVCKQLRVASVLAPELGGGRTLWQREVNGRWPLNPGSSVPILLVS